MWCDGGESPSRERSPSFSRGMEMSPSTTGVSESPAAGRVPSVTPPKPPPPYYNNCVDEVTDAEIVKKQLSTHFDQSGLEGISRKYESSVTETAALRRQVHSLKQQLASNSGGDPLMISPVHSPSGSPTRVPSDPVWAAMNVDVVTKLQALEQVDTLKLQYEDKQHELQQELLVKEEVLAMLTEQMKSMVDKSELTNTKNELFETIKKLQATEQEGIILTTQHSALLQELRNSKYEKEKLEKSLADQAGANQLSDEHDIRLSDLQNENIELSQKNETLQHDLDDLQKHLQNTQKSLASTHLKLDQKTSELSQALSLEEKLAEKESVIKELADSLQAQALAHKQTIGEAQEREGKFQAVTEQKEQYSRIIETLQVKLKERETTTLEKAARLEEKENEAESLQSQLSGFTDHLQSHLSQKDEEIRRSGEAYQQQIKLLDIAKVELEAKIGVLEGLLDEKTASSKKELQQQEEELAHQKTIIDGLQRKNDIAKVEIEKLENILSDSSRNTHELIDRQLSSMRAELSDNMRITSRLEAQLADRDQLISTQQGTISNLQSQSLDSEQLHEQAIDLSNNNKALVAELESLRAHIAQREIQNSQVTDAFSHLQQEHSDLKDRYEQQVATSVLNEEAASKYKSDLATAEDLLDKMRKYSDERLCENNQQANVELQNTKESLTWISKRLEEVSSQLSERDTTIATFKKACENKDIDISKLKQLLQKSSDALDLMQATDADHQRAARQYQDKIDSLDEQRNVLENAVIGHQDVLFCSGVTALLVQEKVSSMGLEQEESLRYSLLREMEQHQRDIHKATVNEAVWKAKVRVLQEEVSSQGDSASSAAATVAKQASESQQQLLSEISSLREALESTSAAHQDAKKMLSESSAEVIEKCRALESAEMHLRLSRNETAELTHRCDDLQRRLSSELQDKELELSEKDSQLERYRSARSELEAATVAKEQLLCELSSRMYEKSADVHHLHVALEETIGQVRVLREQLVQKESAALTHSQEVLGLKKQIESARQQEAERSRLTDSKTNTLEQELSLCYNKLKEKDTHTADLNSKLLRLEEELSTAKTSLIASKGEGDARTFEAHEMLAENKRNKLQIDSLRAALSEKDDRLSDKFRECERLRSELQETLERSASKSYSSELPPSVTEIRLPSDAELRSELALATRRITLLEEQLAAASELADTKTSQRREQDSMMSVLKADLTAKDTAIRQLQVQLNECKKSNVTNEHAAMAEEALVELTGEVQRLRANAQSTEKLMKSGSGGTKSEVLQLRAALEDEMQRVERLNVEVQKLHTTMSKGKGTSLREIQQINDRFADKYSELENRFCTPYITPAADEWDSSVVAAFVRSAKQWFVDYCSIKTVGSTHIGVPPKVSPPRSRHLLSHGNTNTNTNSNNNNKVIGATPGARHKRSLSSSSNMRTFPTTPTSSVQPSVPINRSISKRSPSRGIHSVDETAPSARVKKPAAKIHKATRSTGASKPESFRFK